MPLLLTVPQLQALRADATGARASVVFEGLTLQEWWDDGQDMTIAAFYNETAVPDFWVWHTRVTKALLTNSVGPEGTTFTWTGNGFITRAAGEHLAWQELFSAGFVNAAQANVRQAFADIFSGTGNAAANRAHLLAMARRRARYIEALLATGTGSTAAPATMTYEGTITGSEVGNARFA